jgi:hypothetical protein
MLYQLSNLLPHARGRSSNDVRSAGAAITALRSVLAGTPVIAWLQAQFQQDYRPKDVSGGTTPRGRRRPAKRGTPVRHSDGARLDLTVLLWAQWNAHVL